jgi:alpha-tubulin suppressor-like RCC1 family protein
MRPTGRIIIDDSSCVSNPRSTMRLSRVTLPLSAALILSACRLTLEPILTVGSVADSFFPTPVAGGFSFKAISLGWEKACALTTAGDAYCWGVIDDGIGASHVARSPERVPGDVKFDTISVGNHFVCGIATDKRTMCWGWNDVGQLGDGASGSGVSTPTAVVSPVPFKSIAAGGLFACGLAATGTAYCWGDNAAGQLGSGSATRSPRVAPSPVAGDHSFTALTAIGFATTCALDTSGAAYCWGSNGTNEFGTMTPANGPFPPTRVATSDLFRVLSGGGGGTCGITKTGDTYCWGSRGVVNSSIMTPRWITAIPFVSVQASSSHACGLTANGEAQCWGDDSYGQLGNGIFSTATSGPVLVATKQRFSRIAVGPEVTCALTTAGAAYCWGNDRNSILGRGI